MKYLSFLLLVFSIFLSSCSVNWTINEDEKNIDKVQKPAMNEIDQKVADLMAKMTLEEKIGQMNQYNGFYDVTGPPPIEGDATQKFENLTTGLVGSMLNVVGTEQVREVQELAIKGSRHGIPLIIGFDAIHGYKTQSPIPLAEAASWDLDAIEKSARVSAIECGAAGINWTFAPMVDIGRDARWGRVMEGGGEDPFLGTKIAVARVKGFQGDDLSANNTIAACAKHFAAYGFAEGGREYNTADIGTSTLHNMVLPPFKAVAEMGIATFMNSFNELNGIPASGDKYLQRNLLKEEWGFEGMIVSDWGSIGEMVAHGYAEDGKHAAELAVNSGSDMDMESYVYVAHLKALVDEGKVPVGHIDDAVRRILKLKYEMGLFDDPYMYCDAEREAELVGHADHHAAVLDVAKKSIVLLKNEDNLLPLQPKSGVVLIGPLASDKDSPLGSWRLQADDDSAISVLEGMRKYEGEGFRSSEGVKLATAKAIFPIHASINEDDYTGMDEAVAEAKNAKMVVIAVGELGFMSGEGRSRSRIDLPGLQQELVERIHKVNKNIVLLVMSGRPLDLSWAADKIPTIVQTWHLGSQSGNAIAEVLYGEYNPSGKLPMSFPRNVGQLPLYYNHKATGRPSDPGNRVVFWSHYGDEKNDALYPFGHGLSYTTFKYDNLTVNKSESGTVNVSVHVTNTGDYDGEEVVQLYIRDRVASVTRPVKELKGFQKVSISKGSSMTINFTLTDKELGFYNNQGVFVVEDGAFDVMVGGSSVGGLVGEFRL